MSNMKNLSGLELCVEDELRMLLLKRKRAMPETERTDVAFAAHLGVSKATYQLFVEGYRQKLGLTLGNAVIRAYPELRGLVIRCWTNH